MAATAETKLDFNYKKASGIPRILQYYGKECFVFSENFTRITFPVDSDYTEQVTPQVTLQVAALVKVMKV